MTNQSGNRDHFNKSWEDMFMQSHEHATPELQARLDELGEKANEGLLTEEERSEYLTYVEAMDVIALLRVKSQAK
jgi:hypothetical protein